MLQGRTTTSCSVELRIGGTVQSHLQLKPVAARPVCLVVLLPFSLKSTACSFSSRVWMTMMMMNMMTEFYFVNQTLESMSWDGFTTAHLKHGLVLMAKTANFTSEETDWFLRLTMAHLHAPRTNSPAALWGVSDRLEKRARRKGLWNSEEPLVDDHVLQTLLHDNDNLVQEINKRAQAATLRSGHRHHIYLRDMDREQM